MSTAVQPPASPDTRPPADPGVVAWRIVGGLVAAVIVLFAAGGVVADFTEQRRDSTRTYPAGLTEVVVETGTGSVEVRAGRPGSSVTVEQHTRSSIGSSARTRESVAAGVLQLRGECTGLGFCSVGYTLTVPAGTAVAVTTSTGSVEASGLDGDLDVTTATGSIELTGLRSERVGAQASTGSVELTFAAAPWDVRAETSTGSVEIVVPADGTAYAVQGTTSVGSNEVSVPVDSSSERRIEARASTGSVEVRAAR